MQMEKSNEIIESNLSTINFPKDICSREKSISYKYIYYLARPFFLAKLSNKEPDENQIAEALLRVLKFHIRDQLRQAQKKEIKLLISHIYVFENVSTISNIKKYTENTISYEEELNTLKERILNSQLLDKTLKDNYVKFLEDLQQGLIECRQYFFGTNNTLNNDRLLVARLYDIAKEGGECRFGFNRGKVVTVSFEEDNFHIYVNTDNEKQVQIINWLLLSEAKFTTKLVKQNNEQKIILIPVWNFSNHIEAAEAVKRILFFYYSENQNDNLLDFSQYRQEECFIATAAYGSEMANEIDILRHWRDNVLMKNPFGRFFVNLYVKVSPPLARIIAKSTFLRFIVRALLYPLIIFLKK